MIIMKFGGTSLRDADAFRNVVSIIENSFDRKPLVVVSAMAGITNLLERSIKAAARQQRDSLQEMIEDILDQHLAVIKDLFSNSLLYETSNKTILSEIKNLRALLEAMKTVKSEQSHLGHAILSTGEILSSLILTSLLRQEGINAQFIDARKIMITSDEHDNIIPIPNLIQQGSNRVLSPVLENGNTVVTQGFIGATAEGTPTTLGRNGSDFSASLLGAALKADEIQIWTDVDGILTADPSIIPSAKLLETMTFDEASELAYFGARVLFPAAIQPALDKGIPVRVLNSHLPNSSGTLIVDKPRNGDTKLVKSIAYKEGITLLTITSSQLLLSTKLIADFFSYLNTLSVPVFAISKSATKISLTIENSKDINQIIDHFNKIGETHVEYKKAVVSIVGENLKGNPDISWEVIKILKQNNTQIDLISQFSSQISFMFIINEKDIESTVKLIHKKYI
ncbi:MAG: aspartate kinase [Calditrichaeota bacterium]|nr:MAG: hypothetical protein DWQ03_08885 [Calditrichota bacterium]MBL1205624.1 aspartate kinase [Calditrichota bacterium]NOG45452.1 aspartate kinase [Calditrichota bacterium]